MGVTAMPAAHFEIFLKFPNFLRSSTLGRVATLKATRAFSFWV